MEKSEPGKPAIAYKRTTLNLDDMRRCIQDRYVPRKIAVSYNDRLSFHVDESLHLKKLSLLDIVMAEKHEQQGDSKDMAEEFDADVTIMVGEVVRTLDFLIEELGGLVVEPEADLITATHNPANPEDSDDPLYVEAVGIVLKDGRPSISLVQRHLRIGYNRAARLIEDMEKAGVVSVMNSSGSRKVLAATNDVALAAQNLHDTLTKIGATATLEHNGETFATFGAEA
jgi:recombination associated protein RdgC